MSREEARARYKFIYERCNSLDELNDNMKDFIEWIFDECEKKNKNYKNNKEKSNV